LEAIRIFCFQSVTVVGETWPASTPINLGTWLHLAGMVRPNFKRIEQFDRRFTR
jgi:hypothetical protein